MSALGIATSGLLAFQRALDTTSHNVANSATEGYSRQRVEFDTPRPHWEGNQYYGQGVNISSVRRLQDELIDTHLRSSLSDNGSGEVRAAFAERIDRLLADASTGLAPTLENFFAAVQDVADDPTDTAARTVMIGEVEALENRFETISNQLDEQRTLLNGKIGTNVDEINQISEAIAELNVEVVSGSSFGAEPNDLLDKRDQLLRDLSEKVDVTVNTQDDNTINVFIGNGQALVMRDQTNELVSDNFSGDPNNPGIGFIGTGDKGPVEITRFITGGELGGLLETREGILDKAQNTLGLIAVNVGSEFNAQNRSGLDLDGEIGGDLFGVPEPKVYGDLDNEATSFPSVSITETRDLTASDYRLTYDGSDWQLETMPDQQSVKFEESSGILYADGMEIDTTTIVGADASDHWLIQPTRAAARQLTVEETDPRRIAAVSGALAGADNTGDARSMGLSLTTTPPATPGTATYLPSAIVVNDAGDYQLLQPTLGADAGDMQLESFTVLDSNDADVFTDVNITFDEDKQQFQFGTEFVNLDPSGTTTIAANGWELRVRGTPDDGNVLEIGVSNVTADTDETGLTTLTPSAADTDWKLELRGTPESRDVLTVDLSKDRLGDNRNLLAMADLQDAQIIESEVGFQDGYNGLLADVGTQTRHAQISRDTSAVVLVSAQEQRETISGVNLDEEAANLLRYQQAYQAAAQVISTTNAMFNTLIGVVSR